MGDSLSHLDDLLILADFELLPGGRGGEVFRKRKCVLKGICSDTIFTK